MDTANGSSKGDVDGLGFPQYKYSESYGMSLRDWFAGMAMQGLLASLANPRLNERAVVDSLIAETAYEIADAMLKERDK